MRTRYFVCLIFVSKGLRQKNFLMAKISRSTRERERERERVILLRSKYAVGAICDRMVVEGEGERECVCKRQRESAKAAKKQSDCVCTQYLGK